MPLYHFSIVATLFLFLSGCGQEREPLSRQTPVDPRVRFVDATDAAGIDFVHTSGRSGRKYGIETMGSGVAVLDYDNDGYVDLYMVNSADLPGHVSATPPRNALYHNGRDGRFTEIGREVGVADTSYGMGCAVGDYDNDGDADLFISNVGPNVLYRNDGERDGQWRFTDIAPRTILKEDRDWSTGCAFVDYDLDGDLDLYVANYLHYELEQDVLDENGMLQRPRRHLAPTEYPGQRDFLYRNDGDDHFTDVTAEAGLLRTSWKERKLGSIFFDADNDGDPDLFQGNDATPNYFYRNDGDGTFTELSLLAGVAYNEAGRPEGTMGVNAADMDGDGYQDLAMTSFQWESNTLYNNLGNSSFKDESVGSGLATTSFDKLSFGINSLDADNDGDLDLYVANGHIDEDIQEFDPQAAYAQRDQLYLNDGEGHLTDVTAQAGPGFDMKMVGRGSAVADYDNDGDLDIFTLNSNQRGVLLRNDTPPTHHWLALRLEGRRSNRDGIGARIAIHAGGRTQMLEARGASSYLSQNDPRLFFGLGEMEKVERIEIFWPSGIYQELRGVAADRFIEVMEPADQQPVARRETAIAAATAETASSASADLEHAWEMAPLSVPEALVKSASRRTFLNLSALRAEVEAGPHEAPAHFALAAALRQRRDYPAAERSYRRALELNPGYAAARIGLGQMHGDRGDLGRAMEEFTEAIRLDSTLAEPHFLLGNIRVRMQQLDQSVPHYERAIALDPQYLHAYVNLSGTHSRQTDYGPAIQALQRGLEALPESADLRFRLGWVYFVQARYDESLEQLRQVVRQEPDRSDAHELIAQIYLTQEKIREAREALRQGLAADSTSAPLRARLGVLLREQGALEEAILLLQRAVRENPDREEAYYNLAQAYLSRGEEERAGVLLRQFKLLQDNHQDILDHKTAIMLNPNDAQAYFNLGAVYSRIGRNEAARHAYGAALMIDPRHVEARNNLGNVYFRRRQLARAIEQYRTVLRYDSTYVRAHNNLGNALLLAGQTDRAVSAFERAVALNPEYARPRGMLAQLYAKQGRTEEAEKQRAAYRRLTGDEEIR